MYLSTPPHRWIYDQQGYQAYMSGDFVKAGIVHIAPSDPMISIVQLGTSLGMCPTSPSHKSPL